MSEKHLTELEEHEKNILLSTIRFPKNLHYLTERLPKANYTPIKTVILEKNKFLQTLAGYEDTSKRRHDGFNREGYKVSESVDSLSRKPDVTPILLPLKVNSKKEDLMSHREHDASYRVQPYNPKSIRIPPQNIERDLQALAEQRKIKEQELKEMERENRKRERELKALREARQEIEAQERARRKAPRGVGRIDLKEIAEIDGSHHDSKRLLTERPAALDSPRGKENSILMRGPEEKAVLGYVPQEISRDAAALEKNTYLQKIYGIKSSKRLPRYDIPVGRRKQLSIDSQIKDYLAAYRPDPKGAGVDSKVGKLPSLGKNPSDVSPGEINRQKLKDLSRAYRVNAGQIDVIAHPRNPSLKKDKGTKDVSGRNSSLGPHYLDESIHIMKYGAPKQSSD